MNFIMSYDRDLIGFRLHEQEPAIQWLCVRCVWCVFTISHARLSTFGVRLTFGIMP